MYKRQAVDIALDEGSSCSVRLIDCVGYMIPGATGQMEGESPRMVSTPWLDREVTMSEAAELGTTRVIREHSTIGVVVTTDGSITDIPREDYIEAEGRVIRELQEIGKPFLVLLNAVEPESERVQSMARDIASRYGVTCLPVNCLTLDDAAVGQILKAILYEFPPVSYTHLRCTDANCPAKHLKRFVRFASKAGLDIDGLSVQTLHEFVNRGYLRDFSDLYHLNDHAGEIVALEGFGEKSCANLMAAIEKSRKADPVHLIFALCIPNIGTDAGKKLIAALGTKGFLARIESGEGFEDVEMCIRDRYMIVGLVGANFIFELLFNTVLSPVIVRLIRIGKKEVE